METRVEITTLDGNLLVETDHGLIPLYNVLSGMNVKTKDGMRVVISRRVNKATKFNYFIDVENLRIRFTRDQLFYQRGKPIEGRLLKKGEKVDVIGGERIITKNSFCLDDPYYYTLLVDSPRSNFCLLNGVIVCE